MLPLTSSSWISRDWFFTTVATFWRPRLMVTLSKTSSTLPPLLTTTLKLSSPGSEASCTSTVISLPVGPASSALTRYGSAFSPRPSGRSFSTSG